MKVTAQARRTGDWWAVEVPEVDGVFTQAKRLDQIPEMVADAVALLEDVNPEAVEVEVVPEIPAGVERLIKSARATRVEVERLQAEAAESIREAALALAVNGYSMRDVGRVLGVSHQRASQLLQEHRAAYVGEAGVEAPPLHLIRRSS